MGLKNAAPIALSPVERVVSDEGERDEHDAPAVVGEPVAEGEAPGLDVIPTAMSATAKKRGTEELEEHTFERLRGCEVVVMASGFRYHGTLVGADENELYLKGETRWWVLPLDRVSEVLEAKANRTALGGPAPGFGEPNEGGAEGEGHGVVEPSEAAAAGEGEGRSDDEQSDA